MWGRACEITGRRGGAHVVVGLMSLVSRKSLLQTEGERVVSYVKKFLFLG